MKLAALVVVTLAGEAAGCGRLGFPAHDRPDGGGDDGSPPSAPVGIAAGDRFSCALRPDGTVWCWGDGRQGQLGDGDLDGRVLLGRQRAR